MNMPSIVNAQGSAPTSAQSNLLSSIMNKLANISAYGLSISTLPYS